MNTNNKFQNLIPLSHKVTIYIPSTQGVTKEANNAKHVEAAAVLLSNCFGGATSAEAVGYWVSDNEGLVKEHPVLVYAYAKEQDFIKYIDLVIDFCYKMKQDLKQEAISLEINNQLYLI